MFRYFNILKSQLWVSFQDRQMPHQHLSELYLRVQATLQMWQHEIPSRASSCLILPGLPRTLLD